VGEYFGVLVFRVHAENACTLRTGTLRYGRICRPESRRDDGYIVLNTGDLDGRFPTTWYHGTIKEEVHEFLKQEIDLLVVAVPLTKATTHFLSTPEFELLHKSNPRGTYVTNISRGQVMDQSALIKALEQKL
jgi:hypothetical protein